MSQQPPRVLCDRPSLALANPCRKDGCKHEAVAGTRMCAGHRDAEQRRRQRKRAAIWGAGGDDDGE